MSPVPPDCASLAFSSGGSGLNVTDRWGAGEDLAISRFEHFADLLERVVQRLLSRFTAQGFVHHDLSRACMAQTTDAVPRVLLIGRLALYGPGAARLHE